MHRSSLLAAAVTFALSAMVAGLARADQPVGRPSPDTNVKEGANSVQAPQYRTERWEEDYSYLKDAPKTDLFDPIKYVPLGQDGWYATFGGQFRDRYENYNHNNWGAGPQDKDGYNLSRLFLDADFHFGQNVRVFVEGRGVWETGREGGPRSRDRDEADLEQGFVDLMLPIGEGKDKVTLRVGRQELLFGAERLIGPADWSNARKNHDGVRLTYATADNQLDAFLTRPVQVQRYEFDNADNTTVFGGIYDSLSLKQVLPGAHTKVEAYALYDQRKAQKIDTDGTARTKRGTFGIRFTSNPKPFDMDVEADYQIGTFDDASVHAYSVATDFGYTAEQCPLKPRTFIDFDIASGDRHPGGANETFDQQFPSGHTYFGWMDFIGRQNIIDLHPGFELTIAERARYIEKMTARVEYHQFWRQSTADAIYDTGGNIIRANTSGTSARNIGSEIDTILRWQVDRHLGTYIGYSHFFHGTYIQDTGAHKDVDFFYVAATYTF